MSYLIPQGSTQAVDDKPSQVASNSLANPQTSQTVHDKPSRVPSDVAVDPKTFTPKRSMPKAKDLEAQPLIVSVAGKKTLSLERNYAQEVNKASMRAESSATSLEKEETVGETTERKDIMTASEHSSTAPPTRETSSPETASVIAAGKSNETVAKDS